MQRFSLGSFWLNFNPNDIFWMCLGEILKIQLIKLGESVMKVQSPSIKDSYINNLQSFQLHLKK